MAHRGDSPLGTGYGLRCPRESKEQPGTIGCTKGDGTAHRLCSYRHRATDRQYNSSNEQLDAVGCTKGDGTAYCINAYLHSATNTTDRQYGPFPVVPHEW